MQIARELSGYSFGGADLLRRAMGKKKPEEMAKQRGLFVDGAAARGVDEKTATYIFDLIEKFAGYGFNKSHSAAYAMVTYQTAWLKTHYPSAFMCAVLSADMDHTDKVVTMIDECRRMEITLLGPDVNHSQYDFSVTDDLSIRYGLGAIKGVGRGAIESVLEERSANGEFRDLHGFCRRIGTGKTNRRVLEALLRAGALDGLGPNRASLMQALPQAMAAAEQYRSAASAGQNDMFGLAVVAEEAEVALQSLPEWSDEERLKAERDTLGLYLTGHPINAWEEELARFTHGKIAAVVGDLPTPTESSGYKGSNRREAVLAGLVVDIQRRGRRLIFTLDDGSGRIECTLFEEKAARFSHLLLQDKLLVVAGSLSYDDYTESYRVSPKEIMPLDEARERYAQRILLKLSSTTELDVEQLAGCLDRYRSEEDATAGCAIMLRYSNTVARATMTLGKHRVRACGGLLTDLEGLFGAEAVAVQYRRNSA